MNIDGERPAERRDHDEGGFTLIELVVGAAITAMIGVVLTSTLFIAFRTSSDVQASLNDSNDRETIAYYFTRDVQNAPSVLTTATACAPAASTVIARFKWTETPVGGATVARELSYSRPTSGATTLVRSSCVGAGARVDTLVARYVSAVTLGCLTSAYVIDPTCGASTRIVRLSITPSVTGLAAYTVDGARRPA